MANLMTPQPELTRILEQYQTEADMLSRIAELEADVRRLQLVMYDAAHLAATLGSGSDGWMRGRFMSISNALNAAIGRTQSSHGDQYDSAGNITEPDPLVQR